MPHLDTAEITHKGKSSPITIEGEARDVTDREDLDEDTLSLAGEPEFFQPGIRDLEDEAPVAVRLPHGPLRSLDASRMMTKWQLVEQLTASLPMNEWDLPEFVYRADMLDHALVAEGINAFHGVTRDDASPTPTITSPMEGRSAGIQEIVAHLNAARVDLTYHEGFPAVEDRPFWQRLPYESEQAYDAFIFYLEQGGARKMTDLSAYDMGDVKQWFHTYYWNFRCKAFDLYRTVDATRRKLHRMISTEDSHYKIAERLLASLDNITQSSDFMDKLASMDPDKVIGVLDKIIKIQRISSGLNANGGTFEQVKPQQAATTNIIMQQITEGHVKKDEGADEFDMLVEDPSLVDMAQNLIIASQKAGKL